MQGFDASSLERMSLLSSIMHIRRYASLNSVLVCPESCRLHASELML